MWIKQYQNCHKLLFFPNLKQEKLIFPTQKHKNMFATFFFFVSIRSWEQQDVVDLMNYFSREEKLFVMEKFC